MQILNINARVWIKPTQNGMAVIRQFNRVVSDKNYFEAELGQWTETSFTRLMYIFGRHLREKGEDFFENGEIHLIDPPPARVTLGQLLIYQKISTIRKRNSGKFLKVDFSRVATRFTDRPASIGTSYFSGPEKKAIEVMSFPLEFLNLTSR